MKIASLAAGILAVILYLLCFQCRDAKKILACKILSSVLYVAQYLLLFAFVGAAMDFSALISSWLAYRKDTPFITKYRVPILILLHAGILAVGFSLYESPVSLLAIAGVLFESAAGWMKTEKRIRIVSLFATPCWFTYNVVCGAYGSAVGSVLAFVSIVTALIRYAGGKTAGKTVDLLKKT